MNTDMKITLVVIVLVVLVIIVPALVYYQHPKSNVVDCPKLGPEIDAVVAAAPITSWHHPLLPFLKVQASTICGFPVGWKSSDSK